MKNIFTCFLILCCAASFAQKKPAPTVTTQKKNPAQPANKTPGSQTASTGLEQAIREVKIGEQTWMGANLNMDRFSNGDVIFQAKTQEQWIEACKNKQPAWCYYEFNPANGTKYGKLYNGFAVNDARGLAPKGWHVPNKLECKLLVKFLGGMQEASANLKSKSGWGSVKSGGEKDLEYCPECQGLRKVPDDNGRYVTCGRCMGRGLVLVRTEVKEIKGGGVNSLNFNAVPGGWYNHNKEFYQGFIGAGSISVFWISDVTENISSTYFMLQLVNSNSKIAGDQDYFLGSSVRCVKGEQAAVFQAKETVITEVKIGDQLWMGNNLDVNKFRNGDPIPEARTKKEWDEANRMKQPAWCYYEFDPLEGSTYGKLYNGYAVNDARGLAPNGWHVPADSEWEKLTDFLGRYWNEKMKSKSGWESNGNGTNSSGFSGLAGGTFESFGFYGLGKKGSWWSLAEKNYSMNEKAMQLTLHWDSNYANMESQSLSLGLSVRCIKD